MKQPANSPVVAYGTPRDLGALLGSVKQALLRPATACAYLGISRTGLHRLSENDPTFPKKIILTRRCVGYSAESLAAWLAAKEAGKMTAQVATDAIDASRNTLCAPTSKTSKAANAARGAQFEHGQSGAPAEEWTHG